MTAAAPTTTGLTTSGLTTSGLTTSGLTTSGLTTSGLTTSGLDVVRLRRLAAAITRVPTAPPYMRGVVNVRGSAIPVVDLRLKFGLPTVPDTVNSRIVVLELDLEGQLAVVGGLADSVHEVLELERSQIREPPRIAMRWRADMIEGLGKKAEQFIIVLDIARVFATDEALIAAQPAAELEAQVS